MRKIFKAILCLSLVFIFCLNVNAECNNEELNEWATKVEPLFKENTETDTLPYAYFLSITPYREDIKIVVYDSTGAKGNGEYYESVKLYGVGAYTNLEEETYTIEVYGGDNSACPNELLKTVKYTVPRLNRMVKSEKCVQNPDLEICKTFTNSTKDMTEEDFNKAIEKYTKGEGSSSFSFKTLLDKISDYALWIVIPLVMISLIYVIRVGKYKKAERDK